MRGKVLRCGVRQDVPVRVDQAGQHRVFRKIDNGNARWGRIRDGLHTIARDHDISVWTYISGAHIDQLAGKNRLCGGRRLSNGATTNQSSGNQDEEVAGHIEFEHNTNALGRSETSEVGNEMVGPRANRHIKISEMAKKKVASVLAAVAAMAGFELVCAQVPANVPVDDLRGRAERGEAEAQTALGTLYRNGQGVPQDLVQAAHWYRLAAAQGNPGAESDLGFLYDYGGGLPVDHTEAAKWYRKAAMQGNPDASLNLGWIYDSGQGFPVDHAEAARWYRQAAELGNAEAAFNLGVMYEQGQGVPRDDAQAARWYREAADHEMHIAQLSLARMYAEGKGVKRDPAEAARWYRKSADLGLATAQYELSKAYSRGDGVQRDLAEAYQWLDLAVFRARGAVRQKYAAERDALAAQLTPDQLASAGRAVKQWKEKWPY